MLILFRAVVERLKGMFATAAAAEFESEFMARDAERRAELLRLAERYEAEGLITVATRLRTQVEAASTDRPAGTVLPALAHWVAEPTPEPTKPVSIPAARPSRGKDR